MFYRSYLKMESFAELKISRSYMSADTTLNSMVIVKMRNQSYEKRKPLPTITNPFN